MTKIRKSKVTIKAVKINDNGKFEVKSKTFSKNNKRFKKDVDDAKKLIEEVSVYNAAVQNDMKDNKQRRIDYEDFKELMQETEEILQRDNWYYTKLNFKNGFQSLGKGFSGLFLITYNGIKRYFKKKKNKKQK